MKLKPSKKAGPPNGKKSSQEEFRVSLKRILVPIDFSEHSKNALKYAVKLAGQYNSELILVYVVEPVVYPADLGFGQATIPNIEPDLAHRAKAGLEQLVKDSVSKDISARTMVRTGNPFAEILTTAKDEHADLIVIATHGHSGVEHLIFGSTAEKVVKRARCPVLMVREAAY